jgi:hypothetical protein
MMIEAGTHKARGVLAVRLNGVKLDRCLWADSRTGEACVICTDASGNPRLQHGQLATRILRGAVSFDLAADHAQLANLDLS